MGTQREWWLESIYHEGMNARPSALVFLICMLVVLGVSARVDAAPQCPKNSVDDRTQTTSNTVDAKSGELRVSCENGRQYLVETKATLKTCTPITIIISWQRSDFNANTSPIVLANFPPKMTLKTLDGPSREIANCKNGQQLQESLKTPEAQIELLGEQMSQLDELSQKGEAPPGEAIALQKLRNDEVFSKGVIDSFGDPSAQESVQLQSFANKTNQLKSSESTSVEDLARLSSDVQNFETTAKDPDDDRGSCHRHQQRRVQICELSRRTPR